MFHAEDVFPNRPWRTWSSGGDGLDQDAVVSSIAIADRKEFGNRRRN